MTRTTSEPPAPRATRKGPGAKPRGGRPVRGENRKALEETVAELRRLGRLEAIDAARVQMVRSMADALDEQPGNAQMWHEYRASVEGLMSGGDDDSTVSELLAELRAPMGDPETA